MGKIAATTFATGPKDDVAVADVYKPLPTSPVNNAPKPISETTAKVAEALTTATDKVDWAKLGEGLVTGGKEKKDALAQLKEATGGLESTINEVKGDLLTSMLASIGFKDQPAELAKGLLGLPGGKDPSAVLLNNHPKVKVLYGAVSGIRNGADLNTAKGVAEMVNSITGDSELAKVLDMESQFAAIGSVMSKATKLKIPGLIDRIIDHFSPEDRPAFVLTNALQIILDGDLSAINRMITLAGAQAVLANVPNAVELVLMSYHFPLSAPEPTTVLANELVDVLNRLDVNWAQYKRNNVLVSNTENFVYASAHAKKLLMLLPAYQVQTMIAATYPKASLLDIARGQYKYAAL